MEELRKLAKRKKLMYFVHNVCEKCGTNRYYTNNGRCVECHRIYRNENKSPELMASRARMLFAKQLKDENLRVKPLKKLESGLKASKKSGYGKIMTTRDIYLLMRMSQRRQCAHCGYEGDDLVPDPINPTLKPHWIRLDNLQMLCPRHKVGKMNSGLSELAYRRREGIRPATPWDDL